MWKIVLIKNELYSTFYWYYTEVNIGFKISQFIIILVTLNNKVHQLTLVNVFS